METKFAPLSLGTVSFDPSNIFIGAIVLVIVIAFLMGVKKEMAMFTVFAGIVGVILAI